MDPIARHYGRAELLDAIQQGLRVQGKTLEAVNVDDLAPVDEFHIRGREATLELAELAAVESTWRVLDVGSGLGGSSRFLADRYDCHVTGVDLTPEYCDVARALSKLVGLGELTEFHCADAAATPFPDAAFDLAWTQHVQMNIPDTEALYVEILRLLKPGGRFVFHDILAGPGGEPHYPTHWAEEASMSHLMAPEALRRLLENVGFGVVEWRDTTAKSRDWFLGKMEAAKRAGGPPPLGLHLLLGDTGPAKFANVGRNLTDGRLTVFQGLLEKT